MIGALLTRIFLGDTDPCYESSNPEYHKAIPIGWNLYRCQTCARRILPERWYHRIRLVEF